MAALSLKHQVLQHGSNYKGRRLLLIGLLVGFALGQFVSIPLHLYQGELNIQPLCKAALDKRHLLQTVVPTRIPNLNFTTPTIRHGPVHPMPFNESYPLDGYLNVLPDKEPFQLHCSVCAVVSSSGQVLHYEAGAEIDQAECIIRMNHAPVTGYEKRVGTRTTVRVASHTAFQEANKAMDGLVTKASRLKVVAWGPVQTTRRDGKGKTYNHLLQLAKALSRDVEIYMLNPARMRYVDVVFQNETGMAVSRFSSGTFLSTGWFTMILATEMCDHIRVYGMISDEYCKKPDAKPAFYHYFDTKTPQECNEYKTMEVKKKEAHRFITEKTIFQRWSKYHNITFRFPTW